jgi:hypothetical protein
MAEAREHDAVHVLLLGDGLAQRLQVLSQPKPIDPPHPIPENVPTQFSGIFPEREHLSYIR